MQPNKNKLSFNLDSYFAPNFYFTGILGIIGGLIFIFFADNFITGIIVIALCLPLCFTRKGVSINLKTKKIKEFINIVGIEVGDSKSYKKLIELRLKSERISQTMNSRGSSTTLRYTEYTIVLVADSGKFEIDASKDRDKMEKRIESLSKRLQIPANY